MNENSYLDRQKRILQKKKQNENQKLLGKNENTKPIKATETKSVKQINSNKKSGTKRTASMSSTNIGENKKKKENLLLTLNSIIVGLGVHRLDSDKGNSGVTGFINNRKGSNPRKGSNESHEDRYSDMNNSELQKKEDKEDISKINLSTIKKSNQEEVVSKKNISTLKKSRNDETKIIDTTFSNFRGASSKNEIIYNFNSKNPFVFYCLEKDVSKDKKNSNFFVVNNINQKQKQLLQGLNNQNLLKFNNVDIKKIKDLNTIKSLQINQLNIKGLLSYCEKKYYENKILKEQLDELEDNFKKKVKEEEQLKDKINDIICKMNEIDYKKSNFNSNPFHDESKEGRIEEKMLKEEIESLELKKRNLLNNISNIKERYKEDIEKFSILFLQFQKEIKLSEERTHQKSDIKIKNKNSFDNLNIKTEIFEKNNQIKSKSIPKYSLNNSKLLNTDLNVSYRNTSSSKKVTFNRSSSYSKRNKK